MQTQMNLPPEFEWMDVIAIIAIVLMIAVVIMAVRDSLQEYRLLNEAYEIVDRTFAYSWDGDRTLELYAWTVTTAKLLRHENPFVKEVLQERIQEFSRKQKLRPKSPRKKAVFGLYDIKRTVLYSACQLNQKKLAINE